jgi:hypothetical protein
MSTSAEKPLMEIVQQTYQVVKERGFGRFSASTYQQLLGEQAVAQVPAVLASFAELPADPHMGDGGEYRYRAYNRYSVELHGPGPLRIEPLPGHSIYQEVEDNAVNGGVLRTFAPLAAEVGEGPLVYALIDNAVAHAYNCDPNILTGAVVAGVHQVRIVARPGQPGLPTPEGIHRDREPFTFQHFMARANVDGGEFQAYDEEKELVFSCLQQECLDTVMFRGTTWHGATPISCRDPGREGYRDILLVDLERL